MPADLTMFSEKTRLIRAVFFYIPTKEVVMQGYRIYAAADDSFELLRRLRVPP